MATTPRKNELDATNEYLGATPPMEFGIVPDFSPEIIDSPVTLKDAELEAFMNEPVMVTVLSGGRDNEAPFVQVSVNGVIQMFRRNRPIVVKRKFVERLARAKETGYDQELDDRLGERMNVVQPINSLRYPFQVNRDDNRLGQAWLRSILAS
ncbi:hypothetical protein ACF8OH_26885 [Delftia sp. WSY_9]|uniref:hypothetical protein n=1 Tax=unclassified Delftia TaxID=2613839 RepID=UPI00370AE805